MTDHRRLHKPLQRDDQFRGGWRPETTSWCDVSNAVWQIRQTPRYSSVNTHDRVKHHHRIANSPADSVKSNRINLFQKRQTRQ